MRLASLGVFVLVATMVVGCAKNSKQKSLWNQNQSFSSPITLLVVSDASTQDLQANAKELGIEVSGNAVLKLTGNADDIAKLQISDEANPTILIDETLQVEKQDTPSKADAKIYYLAKKDFGLPEYWKTNPSHDGRGVVAALIDDGVSPIAEGLKTTTEGKRKFLARKTTSDLLQIKLSKVATTPLPKILEQFESLVGEKWLGQINEAALLPISDGDGSQTDLNADGVKTVIDVAVIEQSGQYKVCLDSNTSQVFEVVECFGTFKESAEFGFWTANKLATVEAEFDVATETLVLTQGERSGDSHGEGVASVMVGHKIGGAFDGVAPGAQFVDYDFSENSNDDAYYTIGDFVTALDWLGQQGVEVTNVSYSFFFTSAAGQNFMKKAIDAVVKKHNMVVSFSAGNNGPGLGSLNRRALYPDNVLVAGAFVSKDLDEYVHGVTGLPTEGRVVYYSSRGPGPQSGIGPTVISPLASLTHSEPNIGFTAFSGTSSASPALAGFATVVISAAKQLGYKIDASAIVHAIRMSGEPLPGVPFIDQGYGLPKIKKALEVYARLMSGDLFSEIKVNIVTQKGPDGLPSNGLLLKTSTLESTEHRVSIGGFFANSVAPAMAANHLETLILNYNAKWLTGPSRLWVSAGGSSFAIGVDADLVKSEIVSGGELNGEIEVINESTGLRVLVIPVTIIDDVALTQKQSWQVSLGAEEGKRIHVLARPGVQGFVVNSRVLKGGSAAVYFQTYNDSKVKTTSGTKIGTNDGMFIPVDKSGHFQLGLFRAKGTVVPAEVEVSLTPIFTQVLSIGVSDKNRTLMVDNFGPTIDAQLVLEEVPEVIEERAVSINKNNMAAEFEITNIKAGAYRINTTTTSDADIRYEYNSCMFVVYNSAGVVSAKVASDVYTVMNPSNIQKLKVICRPFDQTDNDSFAMDWLVRVVFTSKNKLFEYDKVNVRLLSGKNTVVLGGPSLSAGGAIRKASVSLRPLFSNGQVKIGEVSLY